MRHDLNVKLKLLLFTFGICISLQACCVSQHTEPSYPIEVYGWKDYKEGTTRFRGSFVLKNGESIDNGIIQMKVVELLRPECTGDAGNFSARARGKLQFARLADDKQLSTDIFPENGGGNLNLPDEFGIFGVGVRAINLKEGWVYVVLTGDY